LRLILVDVMHDNLQLLQAEKRLQMLNASLESIEEGRLIR
jgi:hypothetical protein